MIQILTQSDLGKLNRSKMDERLKNEIEANIINIDRYYGIDRNVKQDDGGFILIIETLEDLSEEILNKVCLNYPLNVNIPEEIEERCNYFVIFFLVNNETSITVYLPNEKWLPNNIKEFLGV
jgi:hypothetical protein